MTTMEITNDMGGRKLVEGAATLAVSEEGDLRLDDGDRKTLAVFARGTWRSAVRIEEIKS